jgi:hypothetical protein
VLFEHELAALCDLESKGFSSTKVDATWPVSAGETGLEKAINRICEEADAAVSRGARLIILSDRAADHARVAVPMLMATGAVHHHLIRTGRPHESEHHL